MQAQNPSSSGAEASTTAFKVGDKVNFVVTRETGRTINMSSKQGEVVEITRSMARVKYRNGRKVWVPFDLMTPDGQPNALTRMLMGGQ